MNIKIEPSWALALKSEFEKPYFQALTLFIKQEIQAGKQIFPSGKDIFRAFELTPIQQVKAVILGQDPYHGYGQAHGLCFSVPENMPPPPSLVNIFKEYHSDLGYPVPPTGDLSGWAKSGVLLLNTILTVEANKAGSHQQKGWETFTDAAIAAVSKECDTVAFILWGKFAQQKEHLIDTSKHLIIRSVHPSPLSVHNGFWGSKPFSRVNLWLHAKGKSAINWHL